MPRLPGLGSLPTALAPYTVPVGSASFEATVAAIGTEYFDRVKIPVAVSIQEAYNVVHFARNDRAELVAKGLDWALVEEIPQRCEFLRELESRVWEIRFGEWPVKKQFETCEAEAVQVRKTLMQDMAHAFAGDGGLLGVLEEIKEGKGVQDFTLDMYSLCELARKEERRLEAVGYDPKLVDRLEKCAHDYPRLAFYAEQEADRNGETRKLRDQAHVFLYAGVHEIRRSACYALRYRPDRLKGYTSYYRKRSESRRRVK